MILDLINKANVGKSPTDMLENHIAKTEGNMVEVKTNGVIDHNEIPVDDRTGDEIKKDENELYDISKFSI